MEIDKYIMLSKFKGFGFNIDRELYGNNELSYWYLRGVDEGLKKGGNLGFLGGILLSGLLIFSSLYYFPNIKDLIHHQEQSQRQTEEKLKVAGYINQHSLNQSELSDKLNKN